MVARRAANSFFAGRSGDLMLVWKPFYIRGYPGVAASHGTPWSYDTHVPLIFMGPGIRAGIYPAQVSPIDLAPTIAAILRINPPAVATGRVLVEAMAPEARVQNGSPH